MLNCKGLVDMSKDKDLIKKMKLSTVNCFELFVIALVNWEDLAKTAMSGDKAYP